MTPPGGPSDLPPGRLSRDAKPADGGDPDFDNLLVLQSRGDSPMKMRWAWSLPVLSILACLAPAAQAQGPMGYPGGMPLTPQVQGYMPMMQGGYPAMPAGYMGPGGAPALLPDAYGAYGSAPEILPMGAELGMGMGMGGGPGMPGGMGGTPMGPDLIYGNGGGGCPYCGGMGCDACGGGLHSAGLLGDVFGCIAP